MANRTVKDAHAIKGTNPQYLVEKIIRSRIYECKYWKEECFALSAELVVDKAMNLRYIGGVFSGNIKPTPFLCLVLKMLQIQPEKDIVLEFIRQQDFKYVRALGAMYMRLTGSSEDCYKFLEPLYLDYRKIRRQNREGKFEVVHLDEFIDELLHEERTCDCILPRIQKRHVLEESNELEPRTSALDDDLDDMDEDEDLLDEEEGEFKDHDMSDKRRETRDWDRPRRSPSPRYQRPRSPGRRRGGSRERQRDRDRRDREPEYRRSRSRERHRRRSRSRDRAHRHREDGHRHRDESDRYREDSDRHRDDSDRHHKRSSDKKRSHRDREDKRQTEIDEANKLRASLGMKPLRP